MAATLGAVPSRTTVEKRPLKTDAEAAGEFVRMATEQGGLTGGTQEAARINLLPARSAMNSFRPDDRIAPRGYVLAKILEVNNSNE